LIADFPNIAPPALRAAADAMSPNLRVSKLTEHWWRLGCDFAVRMGVATHTPAFEEVFDFRPLRQIERDGPDLFNDLAPIPSDLRL
jgi:hypothetical protein